MAAASRDASQKTWDRIKELEAEVERLIIGKDIMKRVDLGGYDSLKKNHEKIKMLKIRVDLLTSTIVAMNFQNVLDKRYERINDDALRQSREIEKKYITEWGLD
jgi:methyl coenzyme M reductase subunit D